MDKNAWVQSLDYLSVWVCLLFDSFSIVAIKPLGVFV